MLFLDEPTSGFDPMARREFHELVHRLTDREQATVLLTTHDLAEAEKLADRVLILAGGRIIADGSPDELALRMSAQAEVRWTVDGQRYVHPTDEATAFTRKLFAQYGEAVEDLEVRRANLEDTYMALVRGVREVNAMSVIRLGLARGGIELRHAFTYLPDLLVGLFIPLIQILVLFLMRGHHVPGTTFSLGSLTLPSIIGVSFAFGGMIGVAAQLMTDREDGTLLRAKATPSGMSAYVLGKITVSSATTLMGLVITLILGLAAFPGVSLTAGGFATLVWVAVLGLLATIPLGITLGSLIPNPRFFALVMLPFGGLVALSGIFYPITHLAGWMQGIGQVFPMYWLGLGMRAALLPFAPGRG